MEAWEEEAEGDVVASSPVGMWGAVASSPIVGMPVDSPSCGVSASVATDSVPVSSGSGLTDPCRRRGVAGAATFSSSPAAGGSAPNVVCNK